MCGDHKLYEPFSFSGLCLQHPACSKQVWGKVQDAVTGKQDNSILSHILARRSHTQNKGAAGSTRCVWLGFWPHLKDSVTVLIIHVIFIRI